MEDSRGDRFRYDEEGQLVESWYNAADPANSGNEAWRYDGFAYDQLGNRKDTPHLASRGWMNLVRLLTGSTADGVTQLLTGSHLYIQHWC